MFLILKSTKRIGKFIFISLFLSNLFVLCSSIPKKPQTYSDQEFVQFAESRFLYNMTENDIAGGYLTIVKQNQTLLSKGFGLCNRPLGLTCTSKTAFKLGSVSKLFTALGIIHLAEKGKLKLTDPATKYLPELKALKKIGNYPDFTIEDMLSHHAGLPSDRFYNFFLNDSASPEEIYGHFRSLPKDLSGEFLAREPRKIHAYSNLTYSLLGLIIERVDGRDFESFMQNVIFKDLRLESTSYFDSFQVEKVSLSGAKESTPKIRDISAGSLSSSSDDMTQILPKFWNQTKPWVSGLYSKYGFLNAKNEDVPLDFGQRIGWGVFHLNDPVNPKRMIVGHLGDLPPFHAMLIFLPEEEIGISIAVNQSDRGSSNLLEMAWDFLQALPEAKVKNSILEPKSVKNSNTKQKESLPRKVASGTGLYSAPFGIYSIEDSPPNLKANFSGSNLTLKKDSNFDWKPTFKIFDLFPITVPALENMRASFYEFEGSEYFLLKSFPEPGSILTLGEKVQPIVLSSVWKRRLGKYQIQRSKGWDMLDSFELVEKDGAFILKGTFAILQIKIPFQMLLKPVSDNEAVVAGHGRGLGDVVRVLSETGDIKLSYLGYQLTKSK